MDKLLIGTANGWLERLVRRCRLPESIINFFVALRLGYKTVIALKRDRVLASANVDRRSYTVVLGICEEEPVGFDPPTALNLFRLVALHAPGTIAVKDRQCT